MRSRKTNNAARHHRCGKSSKVAGALTVALLLAQVLFTSQAFAASESTDPTESPNATTSTSAPEVIQRDGKYYLYQNGKPLTATGYDDLEIEQHDNFPDLAEARLGSEYGLLDAKTGKVVLPFVYQSVKTGTLDSIGLIQVRRDDRISFVQGDGRPAKSPSYDAIGDFDESGQALAERDGKLFVLTFGNGQLRGEDAAPRYLPSIVLPPGLRERATNPNGPLNGTYVAAPYPDLKTAWDAWRKGQLLEPAQPAVVVKGDIAYVSFGILVGPQLPAMPNTLRACQSEHGLVLRGMSEVRGCASTAKPLLRFQREADGSLRCNDCDSGMPHKWLRLPAATQSLVGIGVGIARPVNDTGALVRAVMPGAPAQLAGVKPGDRITSIDGQSTAAMSLEQITALIRGQPSTTVTLGIERESRQLELRVERKAIVVEAD
jgi:hypothetical protein